MSSEQSYLTSGFAYFCPAYVHFVRWTRVARLKLVIFMPKCFITSFKFVFCELVFVQRNIFVPKGYLVRYIHICFETLRKHLQQNKVDCSLNYLPVGYNNFILIGRHVIWILLQCNKYNLTKPAYTFTVIMFQSVTLTGRFVIIKDNLNINSTVN